MFTIKYVFTRIENIKGGKNDRQNVITITKIHEADRVEVRESEDFVSAMGYLNDGSLVCGDTAGEGCAGGMTPEDKNGEYTSYSEILSHIYVENKLGKTTHALKNPHYRGL